MIKKNTIQFCLGGLLMLITMGACNKSYQNMLDGNYPDANQNHSTKENKVLYILVDDLPGSVVQELNDRNELPTITTLLRKSIYSYNSISEAKDGPNFTSTNGLTNLMTGVISTKHQVREDYTDWNKTNYPSILARYHKTKKDGASALFSTSSTFAEQFADSKSSSHVLGTDQEVQTTLQSYLADSKDDIIVAHYSELTKILAEYDDDFEHPSYIEHVKNYDSYIKALKSAIENRTSYASEDWIIVVSSSNGAKQSGTIATLYDDQSRNTFTMFYNSRFTSKYYARPTGNVAYADSTVRFVGLNSRGKLADPDKYNFGQYGNYTIQLLFNAGTAAAYYPTFLAKRAEAFEGSGWQLFLAGTGWEFRAANLTTSFMAGAQVADGQWHVITVVFDGTNKQIRLYQDGQLKNTGTMNATNLDNDIPLSVGQIGANYTSSNAEFRMNNLQIYNRAFTNEDVLSVYCNTSINENHPFYNDMIGYWKGNEFGKNRLKESLGTGNDFVMSGPYVWDTFNTVSANLCPPVNDSYYKNVVNSVDLPFMIFNWLGIAVDKSWNWDGYAVPLPYELVTQ